MNRCFTCKHIDVENHTVGTCTALPELQERVYNRSACILYERNNTTLKCLNCYSDLNNFHCEICDKYFCPECGIYTFKGAKGKCSCGRIN
jgi:hypothetical protein